MSVTLEQVKSNWYKARYEEVDWEAIPEDWGVSQSPVRGGKFIGSYEYTRHSYDDNDLLVLNVTDPDRFNELVSLNTLEDVDLASAVAEKVEQEAALVAHDLGHTIYLLVDPDGLLELRLYDTSSVFSE